MDLVNTPKVPGNALAKTGETLMAVALDGMEKTDRVDTVRSHGIAKGSRPDLPFTFTGQAGEYFGIWIVNILLSVVTLGIYSAWAKVRNKRYFYGNTSLSSSSFAYHASPLQILKGRLIAFTFFAAYAISSSVAPALIGVFVIATIILTPWVVVRARAFNAFQSSYRNVRFGFTGGLWRRSGFTFYGPSLLFSPWVSHSPTSPITPIASWYGIHAMVRPR